MIPAEMLGVVPPICRTPYDIREVIMPPGPWQSALTVQGRYAGRNAGPAFCPCQRLSLGDRPQINGVLFSESAPERCRIL